MYVQYILYICVRNSVRLPNLSITARPTIHLPPRVRTDPMLSTAIAFHLFLGGFPSQGMVLCAKKNVGADGTEEKVFV